ncbi:MucR family transcriptional regulator [Methylobacterium indicum]|uniref:MucR family transcriptional regulator n=1 Tax=Methylobacterium indicum TaxID=1775910 RepID=UPI0009E4DE60|nr:MucR family transcriptional regulator [Methylobacterium indicum]
MRLHETVRHSGGIRWLSRPQRTNHDQIVVCTARIVMGYVAGNRLPPGALAALVTTVAKALRPPRDFEAAAAAAAIAPAGPEVSYIASDYPRPQAPARLLSLKEIADSVQETYLVCFEDGMHYRMLARHLRLFGLTPDAYREKWGLPDDYPMMPAADLRHRAELARQRSLGKHDRSTSKPRGYYVAQAKALARGAEIPTEPKAYSTDLARPGWRRRGEVGQGASPG